MNKNIIKRYIRDENNTPRGVVVVVKDGDNFRFGYSLCSPNDRFSKQIGTAIALNRATHRELNADEALAPTLTDRRAKVLDYYQIVEKQALNYFQPKTEA